MPTKIWSNDPIKDNWSPYEFEDFGADEVTELFYGSDDDLVNSPAHYADKEIEVIDYIDDTVPDSYSYCFGNAIKYLSRHMKKGKPIRDLQKCKWYIDRMIEDNK